VTESAEPVNNAARKPIKTDSFRPTCPPVFRENHRYISKRREIPKLCDRTEAPTSGSQPAPPVYPNDALFTGGKKPPAPQ